MKHYLPEKRQKFGKEASVHIPAHCLIIKIFFKNAKITNYFYRKSQTIYLPEKRQKFGKEASVHVSAHLVENKPISIRAFVDVMFHMSHMTMGMEITVNMHPYNKIPKSWTSLYLDKLSKILLIKRKLYIFQNVPYRANDN